MAETRSLDWIRDICRSYMEIIGEQGLYRLGYNPVSPEKLIEACDKLQAMGLSWGDPLSPPKDFEITKTFYLVNPTTHYQFDKDRYYIEWCNGNIGRLQFLKGRNGYWCQIADEWREFREILLSYKPLDYDLVNDEMIFDIKNGRRLMDDYLKICSDIQKKVDTKTLSLEIGRRKKELEALIEKQREETDEKAAADG